MAIAPKKPEELMKPQDVAPVKQRLLDYLQDNPVRRAVHRPKEPATSQSTPPELSPAAREAYQMVVAKTIVADRQVEPDEIARLYCLFAALDTIGETRVSILRQLAFEPEQLDRAQVPDEILQSSDLRFALARDALLVGQMQEDDAATQEEILRILGEMQLTPAQADVMFDWVQLQNAVLRGLATGVEWASSEENISAFSKRAEDVGLPVGALILSGTKRLPVSDITATLKKLGDMTGIGLFKDPVRAGIALLVITGVTVAAAAGYVVTVLADQARDRAAGAQMLALQLEAASMLAADIPEFEESPGLFRGRERREMTVILHEALVGMLDRARVPLEAPLE